MGRRFSGLILDWAGVLTTNMVEVFESFEAREGLPGAWSAICTRSRPKSRAQPTQARPGSRRSARLRHPFLCT